ncbi:hypothetical protein ASD37_21540 [Mycobacterium sp. Root135]|uniref:MFS transporter n=1 Tax=Mycobacterium sp. Root135 TaxID=1736457 RepID=UPI0006F5A68B|nr:MFS transporter [Mycobacterium sp. Root135]KQY04488.1 hypothetical protein ASD37_21540 [Mycobacterium sp. Root135]
MNGHRRRHQRLDVLAATFSMVTTASPPFLLGTMGSGIRADLAMSIPALAGVISFGYLVAAAASPLGGRVTQRIGPPRSLRLAGALTSLGVGGAACSTTSVHLYAAFLAIGLANAVIQPASNGTLSGAGTGRSQGLLFGMVQSAIPAATLLAGLLLAALDDVGLWRRALWVLFALSLMPQCLIARRHERESVGKSAGPSPSASSHRSVLAFLLVAAFLGSAATTAVAVFGVASGLAGGLPPVAAATGQILGSVCCIVGRIAAAWRWGQHQPHRLLHHIATLQILGVAGVGLLAVGSTPAYFLGFAVAFGCGWGWTGLQNLALVRTWPTSSARVTGVVQSGLFAGSVAGPAVLGGVIGGAGYSAAWTVAASALALASVATIAAAVRLRREHPGQ